MVAPLGLSTRQQLSEESLDDTDVCARDQPGVELPVAAQSQQSPKRAAAFAGVLGLNPKAATLRFR